MAGKGAGEGERMLLVRDAERRLGTASRPFGVVVDAPTVAL